MTDDASMLEQTLNDEGVELHYQRRILIGQEWPAYVRALADDVHTFDGIAPVIDTDGIILRWEDSGALFNSRDGLTGVDVRVSDAGYEFPEGWEALMDREAWTEWHAFRDSSSDPY